MDVIKENKSPWRPSKVWNFVEAFKKVLEKDEFDVVILTDDELRLECNEYLDEKDQICDSTFEKWKAWKLQDSSEYQQFLRLYKKALWNQKRELFKQMKGEDKSRQRYAWIIERKFSEWNLKQITDMNLWGQKDNQIEIVWSTKG